MREYRNMKVEESSMELLIQLHERVKEHPYRLDGEKQFRDDYRDLLYDISHIAYCEIKKYCDKNNIKNGIGMFHDFNGSIMCLGSLNYNLHVERCLMVIHNFIKTGVFNEYWTYYTGCNIEKGMNRVRRYVIDPETNSFEGVYTLAEIDIVIKYNNKYAQEYTEKAKTETNENGYYHRYGRYYVERVKYYIEYKRKLEQIEENKRLSEIKSE